MGGLILAIAILGGVGWWLNRRKRGGSRRLSRKSSPSLTGQLVPPHLMHQLDRLTRDRRVSNRLIEKIAFDHPNRSKRWCVEKAIYDLQRDRRS